jgi:Holliday junction resolvasome RuvABC endonuclease subunit
MYFLALDLGTTTGWSVGDWSNHSIKKSGSINFKPTRFQSHGQRYVEFKKFLISVFNEYGLQHCFYEEVRKHIGTDAAHVYGGYVATLQSWCIENNIQYSGTPVGTIKKHITGKGNAGKEDVIMAVKQKLNIFPKDDNEADAISLCHYHLVGEHPHN